MTAGLGRARDLLAKAEDQAEPSKIPGMAAHAEALAAVEAAGAAQLSALVALTDLVKVSAGVRTATVLRHAALPLAGGQVLPAVVELTGLIIVLSPLSTLLTVTV